MDQIATRFYTTFVKIAGSLKIWILPFKKHTLSI